MPPATAADAPARHRAISSAPPGAASAARATSSLHDATRAARRCRDKGTNPIPDHGASTLRPSALAISAICPGFYLVFGPQGRPVPGATANRRRPHLSPKHVTAQPDQSGSGKMILTGPGAPAGALGCTGRAATGNGTRAWDSRQLGRRWRYSALVSPPGSRNYQHFTSFG